MSFITEFIDDFTLDFKDIFSRPLRRAVARFLDNFTVVLTTGRKVSFDSHCCFSYEGNDLSESELKEVETALSILR